MKDDDAVVYKTAESMTLKEPTDWSRERRFESCLHPVIFLCWISPARLQTFKSRNDSEIFLTLLPPSLIPCGYSNNVYTALDIL